MKRSYLKRSRKPIGHKLKRDWPRMTEDTHKNSPICEWCGEWVPEGTPPAHLIPRDKNDLSLDESWNTASMCLFNNKCHARFDLSRARAVRRMKADGDMTIPDRIAAHPRLKEYFERKEASLAYFEATEGG